MFLFTQSRENRNRNDIAKSDRSKRRKNIFSSMFKSDGRLIVRPFCQIQSHISFFPPDLFTQIYIRLGRHIPLTLNKHHYEKLKKKPTEPTNKRHALSLGQRNIKINYF